MSTTKHQAHNAGYVAGYQTAMAEVAERIDDPHALRRWVADNYRPELVPAGTPAPAPVEVECRWHGHVDYTGFDGVCTWCGKPVEAEAEAESCEHGLSAWLCAGPGHYPTDAQLAAGV